jgi:recombination protein RecA
MSKEDQLDKLLASINKQMTPEGADRPVAARGADIERVTTVPCSSYALGYLLGTGGWFEGKLHEFFGAEAVGKTSLLFLALRDCFQFYQGERAVALIDVEHRFNPAWAEQMGLSVDDQLIVIQPPNAETATDIMHKLIVSKQICAIGFDSIGGAAGWREQQTFDDQATMYGGVASVMTRNVKTIAPIANLFKVSCFYLNQLRADLAGYNRPTTSGGHAVKHMMSLRLYLRKGREKYMDKTVEGDVQVGHALIMKTVKNSYGPTPREQWSDFYTVPSRHLDHVGFDLEKELQRLGILTGIITQSGSWYSYGDVKGLGRDKFFEALTAANLNEQLAKEVMASIGAATIGGVDLDTELQRPDALGPEIDDPET